MVISVIVPIYNTPSDLLLKCLESLRQAINAVPEGSVECILVNDGSTVDYIDNDVKEISDKEGFIYIKKDNGGTSSSRNYGINMGTGDYLMFVDSDDWIEPDSLVFAIEMIHRTHADAICFGLGYDDGFTDANYQSEIRGEAAIRDWICELVDGRAEALQRGVHLYGPVAKVYRSELIKEKGLRFDCEMQIAEDFWFNLCFFFCCKTIVIDNKTVYHYVTNENSVIHSFSGIRPRMNIDLLKRLEIYLHEKMDGRPAFRIAIKHQLLNSLDSALATHFVHPENSAPFWQKRKELRNYLKEPTIRRWIAELRWSDAQNLRDMRNILLLKSKTYWLRLITIPVKRKVMNRISGKSR